jgi:hypothetical protein
MTMFCGWRINGKVQQEPPDEFWDRLDKVLREFGLTIREDEAGEEDEHSKAG